MVPRNGHGTSNIRFLNNFMRHVPQDPFSMIHPMMLESWRKSPANGYKKICSISKILYRGARRDLSCILIVFVRSDAPGA